MKVIKLLLLIALFMSIPSFAQDNANSLNGENLLNNLAHAFLNGANAYVEHKDSCKQSFLVITWNIFSNNWHKILQ